MTELFETFDDDGDPAGLVERATVHARGLWHRSSHVFLFTTDDRLVVQTRAADKDLYAGRLDYSVGEHLITGESHVDGARRGLLEELGVTGVALVPLGGVRRAQYEDSALGVKDFEIQQGFRGIYDGILRPDPGEVAAVDYYEIDALKRLMIESPDRFTPWFARELRTLGG